MGLVGLIGVDMGGGWRLVDSGDRGDVGAG